ASRPAASQRDLLEEAEIVLVEHADVVHAVQTQRQALDADAEREAGVLLRVVPDGFEDGRVHHAAAEHFQPSGLLAQAAALAAASLAFDVELGRRLRVREEAGAEPRPDLRVEEALGEG